MKTYKAPDNSLHVIEPEFTYLLPAGCVEITEEEAEAIRETNKPIPVPPTPQQQIDAIEAQTKMNRAVREGMLLLIEREAMREFSVDLPTAQAGLYAGNPAYKRIKDIDNSIVALRALL
jgi:hypothetical protein